MKCVNVTCLKPDEILKKMIGNLKPHKYIEVEIDIFKMLSTI